MPFWCWPTDSDALFFELVLWRHIHMLTSSKEVIFYVMDIVAYVVGLTREGLISGMSDNSGCGNEYQTHTVPTDNDCEVTTWIPSMSPC